MGRLGLVFGAGFGSGLLLLAGAAAAQEELDQLLQAERDEEADTDGDEVERHGDRLREHEALIMRSGVGAWLR